MQISPQEIDTIEEAGILDGWPVKLLKTIGGFFMAVGKPKGAFQEQVLAAGSHGAIVRYNLQKQYPQFQPTMMKSELYNDTSTVEKHSHFLSDDLRKSGHDIFSIQDGQQVDFVITKYNDSVANFKSKIVDQSIVFEKMSGKKEFAGALAGATVEKAASCGLRKVRIEG